RGHGRRLLRRLAGIHPTRRPAPLPTPGASCARRRHTSDPRDSREFGKFQRGGRDPCRAPERFDAGARRSSDVVRAPPLRPSSPGAFPRAFDSPGVPMTTKTVFDSFGTRRELDSAAGKFGYYSLPELERRGVLPSLDSLPFSIRI